MQETHWHRGAAFAAVLSLAFVAADWRQFRGPAGSGIADATGMRSEWTGSQGVLWKTALPGYGASSPIVLGQRVYLTYYSGYGLNQDDPGDQAALKQHVACFALKDGQPVWDTPSSPSGSVHEYQGYQALHGYASSTLATDGELLFFFFGRSGAGAMSPAGEPRWLASVGTKTHNWGTGTSPVLYDDLVILNASVESGALVALRKDGGQEVWRADGIDASWNTPVLVTAPDGSTELVVSIKGRLRAFHPATGDELWWCDSFQDYVCPSAIAHEGIVYAIGARRGSAVAVKAGGRGDVTKTHRLWSINKGSNVSSPVHYDGHLFWVHEQRGVAYCVDAKTGAVVYEERLSPRPDRIYASPVVADGKIYIVSRSNGIYVLAAQPKFELLAYNEPLDDSIFNGSPAVADNRLLIRSDKHLYCIGN